MWENDMPYSSEAIKAAKDLGYPKTVINAIKAAKTENEIIRIMATAREKYLNADDETIIALSGGYFTPKENKYIEEHCDDDYREIAKAIKRKPESVRQKIYRYRRKKELYAKN